MNKKIEIMLPTGFEPVSLAISNLYRRNAFVAERFVEPEVSTKCQTEGLGVALCHHFFRQRFLVQPDRKRAARGQNDWPGYTTGAYLLMVSKD